MRTAEVYFQDRLAGTLDELDNGYRFSYAPDYLSQNNAAPISLSLPLQREPFEDKRLFPFFDGLIPEGWLLDIAENTWKLNPRDRMGLLLACCRDCIGAVSIVPLPEDSEESALTINGRKRRIGRTDFLRLAESLRLNEKQVINAFSRFEENLIDAHEMLDSGLCSNDMKYQYKALVQDRAQRLGLT